MAPDQQEHRKVNREQHDLPGLRHRLRCRGDGEAALPRGWGSVDRLLVQLMELSAIIALKAHA